ncbi:hypothetical protein [Psychrobacter vallis]|uniref:hypothetical protein n=1 Tax=Psychrobacter vallis TaxID=248451 RepID=UPI00191838A9|nr:hypothetical protein [Psychrobacter vallis]
MSRELKCPVCDYKLRNRFILVFQIKNIGDKRLPCPNCGYELIDEGKLMPWAIKAVLLGVPIALIIGNSSKALYFIIPVILVVWFLAGITIPLKPAVRCQK